MGIVVNIFNRCARPRLTTPCIGEDGDLCDRSFEGECDVDYILRKYGAAGDGAARFGVTGDFSQIPSDLVDLHNHMADIAAQMLPGESVDEFIARIAASDKPQSEPEPKNDPDSEPEKDPEPEPEKEDK